MDLKITLIGWTLIILGNWGAKPLHGKGVRLLRGDNWDKI